MAGVELVVVTMSFHAAADDDAAVRARLARYVVLARDEPGCRNVDLLASATAPGRYVVISKWASPADQRAHLDSNLLVELAEGCAGLLTGPPTFDLLDPISAHDLR